MLPFYRNDILDGLQFVTLPYLINKIGTGDFGLFSLIMAVLSPFGSTNLNFGDIGWLIAAGAGLTARARMIAARGQLKVEHAYNIKGCNSRLDRLQAPIRSVKLPCLEARHRHAACYLFVGHYTSQPTVGDAEVCDLGQTGRCSPRNGSQYDYLSSRTGYRNGDRADGRGNIRTESFLPPA
jgi:hypothetical protein